MEPDKDIGPSSPGPDTDVESQAWKETQAAPPPAHLPDERGRDDPSRLTSMASEKPTVIMEWDSPENPENPRNWSFGKRAFHTAIPALYGFVLTIGTSSYVPAIPFVMKEFKISREVALLPLSLYIFGFIIGPLIAAPISELYGRRVVYWSTLPMLLIFTGIASAANNISVLIIFRVLAGIGGSGALAVGAGTIADLWDMQKHGGRAALFFILAPFLGPSLGPLTGAYIIHQYHNNWRFSLWLVLFIGAPLAVAAAFMQETSEARILELKGKARSSKSSRQAGGSRLLLQKLRIAIVRPLEMMFLEPLVAYLSIYTGFAFAMLFSFFGSYNYVFQAVYAFNQRQVGLTFLGIFVGFLFAIVTFGIFDATLYRKAAAKAQGKPAPEHRLYAALLGSFLLPISLFWFAWSPMKGVPWIVPVLAGVPFGWGCLAIFLSATTYLVDVYLSTNGASAIAANGILRYCLGSAFPLFTLQMYTRLDIHWAGTLFAFLSVVLMPVPWVFFWKGKALRARSRYETNDA
ncbi:hypothetical protein BP6252_09023 [Coleophoma cylindrospora]|uniref:Major facilitator superfamily (MFS) profile domain-containing protein n=1 Tax=Coleophoma cylindrospora TaxID=1849047 RepID=A0A3D8R0R2_9HELO|nr:hypothetical protein BP6252_09023 [Coleophoma cylindrospora]